MQIQMLKPDNVPKPPYNTDPPVQAAEAAAPAPSTPSKGKQPAKPSSKLTSGTGSVSNTTISHSPGTTRRPKVPTPPQPLPTLTSRVMSVIVFDASGPPLGLNCASEGDAGPAAGCLRFIESLSSSSESLAPISSRSAPRMPVLGRGLFGSGRSVSSSNSSTIAGRLDMLFLVVVQGLARSETKFEELRYEGLMEVVRQVTCDERTGKRAGVMCAGACRL